MIKKGLFCFLAAALLVFSCGCAQQAGNITFTGQIEEINDSSLLVTATDDVGFDKASVDISGVKEIPFNLIIGQKLKITILPEIRESYPVQVTAVALELASQTLRVNPKP